MFTIRNLFSALMGLQKKTLFDFLWEKDDVYFLENSKDMVFFEAFDDDTISVSKVCHLNDGRTYVKSVSTKDENELKDLVRDALGVEFNICNKCGKPFTVGYESKLGFASCDECFFKQMDKEFPYGWRSCRHVLKNGGSFLVADGDGGCYDPGIYRRA